MVQNQAWKIKRDLSSCTLNLAVNNINELTSDKKATGAWRFEKPTSDKSGHRLWNLD